MKLEDKIEILKALGVDASKTEIVFEKNVEYEIGNVESGGIAVQNVYNYATEPSAQQPSAQPSAAQQPAAQLPSAQPPSAQPSAAQQPAPRKRRSTPLKPRVVDEVFTYRFLNHEGGYTRLVQLYKALLRAGWIHQETKPDDFNAIFEGEARPVKVKWTAPQANLYYLVKALEENRLISLPQGSSIWVVTGSHFLDSDSRQFGSWNKQKTPKKAKAAIDRMVNLLDPTKDEKRNS
ncbi:MAG: hypothetical protein PUC79_10605 [Prevotellaceae bacterium]|nr:hypothetical protein [Prevotellaceae bacterium]